MRRLLSAELLKLRTTRTWIGIILGLLAITAIATAGTIASAGEDELSTTGFQEDIPTIAQLATLFALLLGVLLVTGEYRHGTATPTFLVTPRRERVVAAKTIASALAGLFLALLALVLAYAVAIPWLLARGADLDLLGGESGRRILGLLLAAALWGALGAGVGAAIRNQLVAIITALAWFLVVEALLAILLELVWSDAGEYLPGAAIDALIGSGGSGELGGWAAAALSIGYVVAAGSIGALLTARRDVR